MTSEHLPTPACGCFPYAQKAQATSTLAHRCALHLASSGKERKWPVCCELVPSAWEVAPAAPQADPEAVPPSWHSPAQWEELAVTVERHILQVEDLQPREVAHVGYVTHFVALQVEASDLGTEASEGVGGNLQWKEGKSGAC